MTPDFPYGPEEWRPVRINPDYEISNYGRLRRASTGRIRKAWADKNYVSYGFWVNGKHITKRAQILVLAAFVGERPAGMYACHNDGNGFNNHVSNLRWDTPSANSEDAKKHGRTLYGSDQHAAKLSPGKVLEIFRLKKDGEHAKVIAKRFGVSTDVVYRVLRRVAWTKVAPL